MKQDVARRTIKVAIRTPAPDAGERLNAASRQRASIA
jgi:hypothetical protein